MSRTIHRRPLLNVTRSLFAATAALAVTAGLQTTAASAAVPGLERVVKRSIEDSYNKSVVATCPAGKQLVGVGGELTGATGAAVIDDITPSPGLTSVTVTGYESYATTRSWSVTAVATCSTPVAGLQLVTARSAAGAGDATATCPTDKVALAAGADITGAYGGALIRDLRVKGGSWLPMRGAYVQAQNLNGYILASTSTRFVQAYAICAYALPGLEQVGAVKAAQADLHVQVDVSCPAGKRMLSGGAYVFQTQSSDVQYAEGKMVIDDIVPSADLTALRVVAYPSYGQMAPWSAGASGVCASV
jgi:hypothetical protein